MEELQEIYVGGIFKMNKIQKIIKKNNLIMPKEVTKKHDKDGSHIHSQQKTIRCDNFNSEREYADYYSIKNRRFKK